MNSKPTIIVYRDELLGASETFIRAQAESLGRFAPYFVGLRPRAGLTLPPGRMHIVSRPGVLGKLQRGQFKLLGPGRSLVRRMEKLQPELIHAHFGPDGCNAMALADALKIPLIVSLHGYDINWPDNQHSSLYLRRRDALMTKARRFLCVSNFLRKQALAKGFPAARTVVHYTGIDTSFFRPKPTTKRLPVVLFVGRLVAEKGCIHLIRAMQQVQTIVPEAKVVIIGDGPLRHDLEKEANERLKNFEFLGERSADIVRNWMNCASVFCTPSVMEGFGMVFAEAQAMGLPVVGFETGGIPEAVANGHSGFLVEVRDERRLGAKLIEVLQDSDLQARFRQAGQQRVREMFDIQKQAVALEEIYFDVLREWREASTLKWSSAQQTIVPSRDTVPPSFQPATEVATGRTQ